MSINSHRGYEIIDFKKEELYLEVVPENNFKQITIEAIALSGGEIFHPTFCFFMTVEIEMH